MEHRPPSTKNEYQVCDLYVVRRAKTQEANKEEAKPFVRKVWLLGPSREIVRVHAIFNDSAMIGVMCITIFKKVKHRLHGWCPSKHVLHMVNGALVQLQAMWTGTIDLNGVRAQETLKVFNSGGGWSFLFGKLMLKAFRANHDYEKDKIQERNNKKTAELENQIDSPYYASKEGKTMPKMVDWKQHQPNLHVDPILAVSDEHGEYELGPEWAEVTTEALEHEADTFTRQTNPFNQRQVNTLLKAIAIGDNLSEDQKAKVHSFIATHTNCFALSVKEVILVENATLNLNILEGTQLLVKTCQCTFTPLQRQYLRRKILEMLEAGIIKCADLSKVRCMSLTTLGQKQHEGTGLTLEELQCRVNEECEAAGL
jgi:hypothetical protein